jgi:nicotinamidase-related amidase
MPLDPNRTSLLVIDVQNEYFDGKWPVPDGEAALTHIVEAIDICQRAGATVVYVQHAVLQPERGVFVPGTHGFDLHARLHPRPQDIRVVKNYPGAFTKTDLEATLRKHGIATLVISGYMTHMCCDTTAREGFHRDFQVLFLDDATATRDAQHSTLGKIDHRALHRTTLITQASTFSQVLPTEGFIQELQKA